MLDGWIERHGLRAHPEGGWYREVFRSHAEVQTLAGRRAASTAILFALGAAEFSAWHRVRHDEVWHHHEGGPLTLWTLEESGCLSSVQLGGASGAPLGVVPGGVWQAARASNDVLVSCTVAPGFDFSDFELASDLGDLPACPEHAEKVRSMIRRSVCVPPSGR